MLEIELKPGFTNTYNVLEWRTGRRLPKTLFSVVLDKEELENSTVALENLNNQAKGNTMKPCTCPTDEQAEFAFEEEPEMVYILDELNESATVLFNTQHEIMEVLEIVEDDRTANLLIGLAAFNDERLIRLMRAIDSLETEMMDE